MPATFKVSSELNFYWTNRGKEERRAYRRAVQEELAGREANRAVGRALLEERRELSQVVADLKTLRERLGISLSEVAERSGMTKGNLSRLENMEGPNPTIATLRRYASALGHRLEIVVVADKE